MSATGKMARTLFKSLVGIVGIAALVACTPVYRNHGYIPTDEDVEEIMVGVDTQETVSAIIGKPAAAGLLTEEAWYYVQSRFKHLGYNEPEEVEREVLQITFDEDGLVENIERFGLEEGRVVVLSRRVTTSNTRGVGFLRQLLGGIGQVNLNDILGN
ncbi:outer membrane protein assembly factor BamE [Maritimibacter dapengensis]|uniref:Outer membrane protein assembly factor BamE n=1 Tax=Maritimibacter dapengensis TaxID=2836868 RepID=A0ABS6T3D9_9RHOB|nr:outer membrane protein assembly factor BamE [Maritimibacter dapengensis]MBV7379649.1 outer membrane protein assembly factor BamE [Maritimibacter dapengensis]